MVEQAGLISANNTGLAESVSGRRCSEVLRCWRHDSSIRLIHGVCCHWMMDEEKSSLEVEIMG